MNTATPVFGLTAVLMAIHVAAGTVALLAGTVAVSARKGGRVHRASGTVFLVTMVVMALFASVLAVILPGQLTNLFVGALSAYLVVTGWLAMRDRSPSVLLAERIALGVVLVLCVPFVVICTDLALGIPLFFKSAFAMKGPILIALNVFTGIIILAAAMDARAALGRPLVGRARLGRHLWRMMLGLTFAAGSGFTNGLPRILPKSLHVPFGLFFIPQFLVLVLLLFWMARIQFPPWPRSLPGRAVARPS